MGLLYKAKVVSSVREVDAWTLGAADYAAPDGHALRIKGGRAVYEGAWTDGRDAVRLERIDSTDGGLRPVVRWVPPETILEVVLVKEERHGR